MIFFLALQFYLLLLLLPKRCVFKLLKCCSFTAKIIKSWWWWYFTWAVVRTMKKFVSDNNVLQINYASYVNYANFFSLSFYYKWGCYNGVVISLKVCRQLFTPLVTNYSEKSEIFFVSLLIYIHSPSFLFYFDPSQPQKGLFCHNKKILIGTSPFIIISLYYFVFKWVSSEEEKK